MSRVDLPIRDLTRWVGLTLLGVLALLALGDALAYDDCATATVDRPIVLPDGSRHAAGVLTLCLSQDFSPVSSLHLAFVDGRTVGQWLSRRDTSESGAAAPVMVFEQQPDGALRLAGYAMPSGLANHGMMTYRTGNGRGPRGGSVAGASKRAMRGGSPAGEEPAPIVLVAAHPR
jgi:hypothetical protein